MLSRDEVRIFIHRAVKEGVFSDFFQAQREKEQAAVDALFDEIFLDAFLNSDNDLIDKTQYNQVVA